MINFLEDLIIAELMLNVSPEEGLVLNEAAEIDEAAETEEGDMKLNFNFKLRICGLIFGLKERS